MGSEGGVMTDSDNNSPDAVPEDGNAERVRRGPAVLAVGLNTGPNDFKKEKTMARLGLAAVIVLMAGQLFAAEFQITSPVVKNKGTVGMEQVFSGFGCTGGNVSPELDWQNAPKETKSFAVTVYDPDAPTGSGWWHWVVFNIPPSVNRLPANAGKPESGSAPKGSVQSMTDYGRHGYGGPCPPAGGKPHRYIFTVYALKVDQLPLKEDASGAMVGFYLNSNALAKATLTATYGR
jgi:Raf kinase inhibitor-like YbhB/YbcL family protein